MLRGGAGWRTGADCGGPLQVLDRGVRVGAAAHGQLQLQGAADGRPGGKEMFEQSGLAT